MRAVLTFCATARFVIACSCSPYSSAPLCQRIEQVKVLFIGTAVETNDDHDGFIEGGVWYRFSVEEKFRGLGSGVREVIVDPGSGTSCQEEFTVGGRYLISSYGSTIDAQQPAAMSTGFPAASGKPRPAGEVVMTGVCSGSRPVESATTDVAFVREYTSHPRPARVLGSIRSHASEFLWDDGYPPLAGVAVSAEGPGGRRNVVTDGDGRFEFFDVSPGKFSLKAALPGFASARESHTIDAPAHGCGVARIAMFTDAGVSGRVIHPDGSPAKEVSVEFALADPRYNGAWFEGNAAKTDGQGRFHFDRVPSGDLLVGVHLRSAPEAKDRILPTYWPGVTERNKAQVIHLAPNEQKVDLVIQLGPPAAVRNVTIQVHWPDGRPSADTTVSASVQGYAAELGKTDQKGQIEMALLEGVEYTFNARAWTSYRNVHGNQIGYNWVDAEEQTLAAGSTSEINLLLNKPKPRR